MNAKGSLCRAIAEFFLFLQVIRTRLTTHTKDMEETSTTVKPMVLDYEEICRMAPFFKGRKKLVDRLFHLLSIDKVNDIHARNCDTPGVEFTTQLLRELDIKLRIDGEELLDQLPKGAFITVSNHAYGALDGIILINMIASRRPKFKVMVNMILNHIGAMRPNFIAVDALASSDPAKQAVSKHGIREAIMQVKRGEPLGFFPAGAVSKLNRHLWLEDRQWQPSVIRIIKMLGVPVVPIFFHGGNSPWFNFLGLVSWQLRTLRLPAEVFNKKGSTFHISVGDIITPETLAQYDDIDQLGQFLKQQTYSLRRYK